MCLFSDRTREMVRCPKGSYRKRYGKYIGTCIDDKWKAYRKPCSAMTPQGLENSKRCRSKFKYELIRSARAMRARQGRKTFIRVV